MKKSAAFLPVILLVLVISIFSHQFLFQNKLPIPADTIIGLYYPFRDLYAATNPNGISYKNFLITDPVRQQYPWRFLSIALEKQLTLPLWNPYNFSGTPLLANQQSAAFYPLNLLLFIFPFQFGWSILVLLQPLLAGIFLYLYLQKMNLSKSSSLLGGIAFAFCGFNTAWLEWNTVAHVILWLPLILLAKEKLLGKLTAKWIIILIFAACSAAFAGHLQTFFYAFIISNIYLIVRIIQISRKEYSRQTYIIFAIKKYLPFLLIGVALFIITSIQILPTFQFISQSAREIDQQDWHKPGWFIPEQHLIQFIAPDFFGNPSTLNYWGVWNYGEFIGYIGIVPLIFALFALTSRRDKKTAFFGIIFFLSLIFSLNTWIGQLPFLLKIPFLSTAQPTRLLAITDFSLAILAALGFDLFIKTPKKKQIIISLFLTGTIICSLWIYTISGNKIFSHIKPEDIATAKRNLYVPSSLFLSAVILIITFLLTRPGKQEQKSLRFITFIFIIITLSDLLRFSWKFNPFTPSDYIFPSTKVLSYLQLQPGVFRTMTTDDRILPPNFSIMYNLQTLDGYDPLYLKRYAELMAAIGRGKPNITPPFGFNRIITPHNYESPIIDLLGVKYILTFTDTRHPKLEKVYSDGATKIYKNLKAYPRAFFVKTVKPVKSKQESINALFNPSLDLKNTAIVENWDRTENRFHQGKVTITKYAESKIELNTKITSSGFLVLTDSYYPTWHAQICHISGTNCKQTKIYLTNYNFRGIVVPKGEYKIIFSINFL